MVSKSIYAKLADMMGGGFILGNKGKGSIQNVDSYGHEVLAKTPGLYLVPTLRNLIF